MEKDPKQLRERAAELEKEQAAMKEEIEKRSTPAFENDEEETWVTRSQTIADLYAQADTIDRLNGFSKRTDVQRAVTSRTSTPATVTRSKKDPDLALRAYLAQRMGGHNSEWFEAADRLEFNYRQPEIEFKLRSQYELNDLETRAGDFDSTRNSVNEAVVSGFEKTFRRVWPWQSVCTVQRTSNGAPLKVITMDDSGTEGSYYDELDPLTSDAIALSTANLSAYKIGSGVFPVSYEAQRDSEVPVSQVISQAIAERLAVKFAKEITVGDGTGANGHIRGFINDVTEAVTADYYDGFIWEDLIDLESACPIQYHDRPGCGYMMHRTTLAFLEKMVDGNLRPLFNPHNDPMQTGTRYSLRGFPIWINNNLAPVVPGSNGAQGQPVVIFGDFSSIKVRIVRDLRMRSSEEVYWKNDATAYGAYLEGDSKYINPGDDPLVALYMDSDSGGESIVPVE